MKGKMIKVTNQEEFEKCLTMLDSEDVDCRLLGWELLCGCTDLHRDALLISNRFKQEFLIRQQISKCDVYIYFNGYIYNYVSYSSLIKEFTVKSKIYLDTTTYIKLKYK